MVITYTRVMCVRSYLYVMRARPRISCIIHDARHADPTNTQSIYPFKRYLATYLHVFDNEYLTRHSRFSLTTPVTDVLGRNWAPIDVGRS